MLGKVLRRKGSKQQWGKNTWTKMTGGEGVKLERSGGILRKEGVWTEGC